MSAPFGNWENVLRNLLEKAKQASDLKDFQHFKDDYERIKYLQKNNVLNEFDWIKKYFDSCHELHQKAVEKAASERLAGNKFFQKKQYKGAVNSYTNAVIQGPTKTEELAMAFGNRSAAWFYLGEFKSCLKDISQAIKNGYPDSTQYKLQLRSAHCNFQLGQLTEASEDLRLLSVHLAVDKILPDKRKVELQRDADDLTNKILQANSNSQLETNKVSMVPGVSYGANSVLVQASTAIDLRCNESQGRFLIANRDLKAGDTLIVERPYAAILLPDHYAAHCHHCFTPLQAIFPCRQCIMVKYCSPECEEESWSSYHRIECPYLDLLHSIGIAHLSLRVILIAGLDFLIDFRESIKNTNKADRIAGLTESGKYERNYLTVYDLMTHTEDMNVEDLYQYSVTAILLLGILLHSKWFKCSEAQKWESESSTSLNRCHHIALKEKPESNHSKSCHKIVTKIALNEINNLNIEEATQNCINSTVSAVHEASDCPNDDAGNINHNDTASNSNDCSNLELHSVCDKTVQQHANLDLCDTEIYIGGLLLRHIQQLVCNAHAITEVKVTQAGEGTPIQETSQVRVATAIYPTASLMNHSCDPTIISSFHKDVLVVRAVKDIKSGAEIFNCYGPHHKRMKRGERQQCLRDQYFFTCTCDSCTDAKDEELIYSSYSCPDCKGPLCQTSDQKLKCRYCQHIEDSLEMVDGESSQASQLFKKGLHLLEQQNYKGQFKKAAKYLQESIDTVRVIYGPQSIELANELRKLSEVLISAREWRQALDVTGEAITLFSLHYGKQHETVRDLCEAQSELRSVI